MCHNLRGFRHKNVLQKEPDDIRGRGRQEFFQAEPGGVT